MTVTYVEIITYIYFFLLNWYEHLLMLAVASYIAQKKLDFEIWIDVVVANG